MKNKEFTPDCVARWGSIYDDRRVGVRDGQMTPEQTKARVETLVAVQKAIEAACFELLQRDWDKMRYVPHALPKDGARWGFVRLVEVETATGSEKRIEAARGNLDRIWLPVCDFASTLDIVERSWLLVTICAFVVTI